MYGKNNDKIISGYNCNSGQKNEILGKNRTSGQKAKCLDKN